MKLREQAKLELPANEICRLLSEAVCTSFSMFENMVVWRITRTKHGNFRVDMAPKEKPARPVSVVDRPKQGSAG